MKYVFDSDILINLFKHYYRHRFPTLWSNFDNLVAQKIIISVREVFNEVSGLKDDLSKWARKHKEFFPNPTDEELGFVTSIFQIRHFQNLIRKQKQLEGKPVADPFLIAKAKVCQRCVVTQEKLVIMRQKYQMFVNISKSHFLTLKGLWKKRTGHFEIRVFNGSRVFPFSYLQNVIISSFYRNPQ